jgi:pimeloyl-ACP methyl ester carboxylesterase
MTELTTAGASSQTEADRDTRHGYAPVNGLDMYYEIHGSGQPLVLLHGAFSAIGTSFGQLLLAMRRGQVIAVELQGHGHTADIVRPEHVVEVFRLLGGGVPRFDGSMFPSHLAIVPGTDHVTLMYRADLLVPMIDAFLDAPMPERT